MLETLEPVPQWGRYHHLLRAINNLTPLVRREPISDTSHLVAISYFALPLSGSVTRDGGKVWRYYNIYN